MNTQVTVRRSLQGVRVDAMSLPFFTPYSSCYPLQLLHAIGERAGASVRTHHAYVDFALRLFRRNDDLAFYKRLTHEPHLGDLVALASCGETRDDALDASLSLFGEATTARIDDVARHLDRYFDDLTEQVAASDVVALTATHFQLGTSLAFARRLHDALGEQRPRILLGGYFPSKQAASAVLAHHDCVDAVVYGEAEDVFADAVAAVRTGAADDVIDGGASSFGTFEPDTASILEDIRARSSWLPDVFQVSLELSRGCYWDKCDFCNFNAAYGGRTKVSSPAALIAHMDALHERFGQRRFQLLDTAVPPRFARFLEREDIRRDYEVFCEIRPDFSFGDLQAMKRLGTVKVQVGVESLVPAHLERMNKNSTVAESTRVLLDCQLLDIPVTWGIMVEHPLETVDDLLLQLRRARTWRHLTPPKYVTVCEVRQSSPLWEDRAASAEVAPVAHRVFEWIVPNGPHASELIPQLPAAALSAERRALIDAIEDAVSEWRATGPQVTVHDVDAVERDIVKVLADGPLSGAELADRVGERPGSSLGSALDRLVARDLVFVNDHREGTPRYGTPLRVEHLRVS